MRYTGLNDLIKDEDILIMAQKHIDNGTIPIPTIGTGKSTIASKIVAGMIYLMGKRKD